MAISKKAGATRTATVETITRTLTSTRNNNQSAQVLEQPVEFIQSLELVQTLVCAVVSTVASLRGIFPEECFKVHQFDVKNPTYSYQAFMTDGSVVNDTVPHTQEKKSHRYVPWEILSRGTNASVNKILDWLELGVADALCHKYLRTLQLGIYDGEVSPSKRIEVYVMAFSYCKDNVNMELQLSGGPHMASRSCKTLVNAKEELRYLVHRLTNHIGGFPELPPASLVQMYLTYNDACPPAYQPPGYIESHDHDTILARDQGALVGSMQPGSHRVNLRVFVNDHRTGGFRIAKPATVVKLRKLTKSPHQIQSVVVEIPETEPLLGLRNECSESILSYRDLAVDERRNLVEKNMGVEGRLGQDQLEKASMEMSIPGTQERMQLLAISGMAQLRSNIEGVHDTQVLDPTQSNADRRHENMEYDDLSSDIDTSSTQGTPSVARGGRTGKSPPRLLSATCSPPGELLNTLSRHKRQHTSNHGEVSVKLQKVSKARSPFITAGMKRNQK